MSSRFVAPPKIEQTEVELHARVERVLPATMLSLLHESFSRGKQLAVRQDVVTFTERAFQAGIEGLDLFFQNRIAGKAAEEAIAILRVANANEIKTLYAAVAQFMLKAANDGVQFDRNALTVAALVQVEWSEDPAAYGGRQAIERMAAKLENETRLRGWWQAAPAQPA